MNLREEAVKEAIAMADAAANNVDYPLYSELLEALRALVANRDAVDPAGLLLGVDDIKARALLAKAA